MTAELPSDECPICQTVGEDSCPRHAGQLPASLVREWLHPRGYDAITDERLARLEELEELFTTGTLGVHVCDAFDLALLGACAAMKPARVQYGKPGELGMSLHDAQLIYAAEMARRRAQKKEGE